MSQQSLRLITRLGARARTQSPALSRSLHASSPSLRTNDTKPKTSQGHTVDKAKDPLYKDGDVQSAAARAGADAKDKSGSRSGESEPFDAARQGQEGGETKQGEGSGPFKDQIGGQDVKGKGPGVKQGKEEVAAGGNIRETIVNSFESLKKMRSDERNFSTSARAWNGTTPRADADGARQPKEQASDVHGDQNAHLKHTSGGSQGGKNQGNASADPKLPSQNKKSGSQAQARSFSTTAHALADPNAPGVGSPGPAEREAQKGAGIKQQPRGDDAQHGGAAGQPSAVESKGAPESSPNPTTGTSAPDPQIPKGQKEGATREGMGVRKFSTSARVMADPNAPGVGGPGVAEREAQKGAGIKQQPRGDDVQHGGAAGQPSAVESKGAPESSPNPTTGTAAPDPQIPKGQKEGATHEGMGVRKFSTSARVRATTPPGGYAKTTPHKSSEAGYNAPPTALPGQLKSAYEEKDPNAVQQTSGDGASSNVPYSSTAVDPPNEALRKAVLEGNMPERNPPPQPEAGPLGIDEAWKHRK